MTQELKPTDHQRRVFVNKILEKTGGFSEEAHFHLNCKFYRSENPIKVTVWYCLQTSGAIGPFFYKDPEENAISTNGKRYGDIITFHGRNSIVLMSMIFGLNKTEQRLTHLVK